MKSKNYKHILYSGIGFMLGGLMVSVFFYFGFANNLPLLSENRLEDTKYKFIKPLLSSIHGNENESLKWFPFERGLKKDVEDFVNDNQKVKTSVFFLNLNNSGWFSVNGADSFIPASLLKLPMMMSYYKLRENEPDLFSKQILYQGQDFNSVKNLGKGTILPGNTYTIKELAREMIVNSDNNALQLLYKYKKDSLRDIFEDMNLPLPATDAEIATKNFLTTRDISRFFLVLYNSSYLRYQDSEEVLKILSETTFKDGLVAGVPAGTVVSHKFGERTLLEKGKTVSELHDCGIVYHPKIPYIICVMTKGNDFDLEKRQIKEISKIIFDGVDSFAKNKK